jgi:hypothetical protein
VAQWRVVESRPGYICLARRSPVIHRKVPLVGVWG